MNKKILRALVGAGSLTAGLMLAGCSAAPTPTAPVERAEPTAPGAKDEVAAAPPSSGGEGSSVAAEEGQSKTSADDNKKASPPPPPQGAPPSWLAKAAAPYRAGDAAQYLPKDCGDRVLIDVSALVGSNASDVRAFIEQAIKAKGDPNEEARVKKAIAILHDAGADPVTDWREVAVCGNGREIVAVGLGRETPIEVPLLAQKVKIALGDGPGAVTREGDISMLVSEDGEMIAQPAANVFLVGKDKEALRAGIAKKAGAPGFAAARGLLIWTKASGGDIAAKQTGDTIDINLTVHLHGSAAEGAKKDPKAVTAKLAEKLKGLADGLKGTPAEPIAERIRAAKIAIRGSDIAITGTIRRSALVSTLKGLDAKGLEELIRSLN